MTFIAFALLSIIILTLIYVAIEISFIRDDLKVILKAPEQSPIIVQEAYIALTRLSKHVLCIIAFSAAFTFIARFILLHWFHNN